MEINFKPSVKQFTAWEYLTDQTTTELGYGGAAHGGKSYLGCFWLLSMCLAYPETGWLMGRKELTNLKRTTLITFFNVCKEFGIEPEKHFDYNQQQNVITFKNGSQIFLLDLGYKPSDPLYTRLGGLELTGAFIDESNEITFESIDILKTRIGRRKNKEHNLKPKLLETFNPDRGHVYSRYYKPYKSELLPSYRKFIQALPADNPHTSQEYLDQLANADKVTKERLLYGNFEYEDDPSVLMDFDAIEDLFTNTIDQSDKKFLVCDIARFGQDRTVLGFWKGLELNQVKMFSKAGTDEVAQEIKNLARDNQIPYSQILIDEDGIGGGVLDQVKGAKGFIANSSPFAIWDTKTHRDIPANFRNMKAQCSFKLAELVNTHKVSMRIDDGNIREMIKEELAQIRRKDFDKDTKFAIISKEEVKERIGRSPDIADMIMMRMYYEFQKPDEVRTMQDNYRVHITRRNLSMNEAE